MVGRCLTVACSLLSLSIALPVRGDAEYWVSVGSYRSYTEAEAAREQAGERLPETFRIEEALLDSGLWYRVLTGPYLTLEIADHMVDEARRQGFVSPWALVRNPGVTGIGAGYPAGLPGSESTAVDDVDPQDVQLDVPASASLDVPGYNAPVRTDDEVEHKLVDEAPPDYRLNRLHRN